MGEVCSGGQSGIVSRYTSFFDAYLTQKTDEAYYRLRAANQRDSRSRSAGHSDSTVMTCSESGESSVASANAVTQGGSGTSSGRPSKVKKNSSLASLLGRKRDAKETDDTVTKKSKKESAKSVGASGASSSQKYWNYLLYSKLLMCLLIYSSFVVSFGQLIVVLAFLSNVIDGVERKISKKKESWILKKKEKGRSMP